MSWLDRIVLDASTSKFTIKGSRIAVDFVIDLLARGWTIDEILREYDQLKLEAIRACLAYTRQTMSKFPVRFKRSRSGRYLFGGPPRHSGTTPAGTKVPLQLVLLIDLSDPRWPVEHEFGFSSLPLYYPFKYGQGGSEVQYTVRSDSTIKILSLTPEVPDDASTQYLRVAELPRGSFKLQQLNYKEARALTFVSMYGEYSANRDDRSTLEQLDFNNLILTGRDQRVPNGATTVCRNQKCKRRNKSVICSIFATVPPIAINGKDDFWHEFSGGDVLFCFAYTDCCKSIFAFNVAD